MEWWTYATVRRYFDWENDVSAMKVVTALSSGLFNSCIATQSSLYARFPRTSHLVRERRMSGFSSEMEIFH